jgi:putative transposase
MTKSAKGTVENPGKNVRQKSGLNRSILNNAFSELKRQMQYKTDRHGGQLALVDAKYTSQTCSCCGHVEKANRKTQASFECIKCGHSENADVNAAKNILNRALITNPPVLGLERPNLHR